MPWWQSQRHKDMGEKRHTASVTNLDTSLTDVYRDDFTHFKEMTRTMKKNQERERERREETSLQKIKGL